MMSQVVFVLVTNMSRGYRLLPVCEFINFAATAVKIEIHIIIAHIDCFFEGTPRLYCQSWCCCDHSVCGVSLLEPARQCHG